MSDEFMAVVTSQWIVPFFFNVVSLFTLIIIIFSFAFNSILSHKNYRYAIFLLLDSC